MAIYGQLTKTPVGSPPSLGTPPSAPVTGGSDEGEKHPDHNHVSHGQVSSGGQAKDGRLAAGATAIGLQAPFVRQGVDEESHFSIATSPTRQRDFHDVD